VIRQLHQQLGKKEEVLNAVKIQQAVVAELTKELSSLEVKEKALKAVSDELSPVDGLIAEGLMGFIRGYVQQMNQFIKKIWTYPLQVKNCGVSDENGVELDYRFPMLVDSPENIKKDVSKGSSGMKDIINFAFRRVAMKYCGLGSSPLFLDEFAITLDKEHRDGATRAIKSMIEAENFTQLFMISHYESMYSAFTNADICVLDTKNIVVPDIYNRHVTIQ
jgi:DNA repair exonuclease SbcCD ATPase subunit